MRGAVNINDVDFTVCQISLAPGQFLPTAQVPVCAPLKHSCMMNRSTLFVFFFSFMFSSILTNGKSPKETGNTYDGANFQRSRCRRLLRYIAPATLSERGSFVWGIKLNHLAWWLHQKGTDCFECPVMRPIHQPLFVGKETDKQYSSQ